MTLVKVTEVKAEGKTRAEAAENAFKKAAKTLHNIKGVYIERISGVVEFNKITKYRLNARVTYMPDGQMME